MYEYISKTEQLGEGERQDRKDTSEATKPKALRCQSRPWSASHTAEVPRAIVSTAIARARDHISGDLSRTEVSITTKYYSNYL